MVGLSIVLENQKHGGFNKKSPQVINKATMIINNKPSFSSASSSDAANSHSTFPVPTFLQHCFLCKQTLLPGKDIYMYKGDRGFCSVECRCRQIFMDEEESLKKENCSFAAMNPRSTSSAASASSSRHRKGTRNRSGGFVY
ncbi:hypothetical protein AB3S75_044112 [Citrus x aurantiifolia]